MRARHRVSKLLLMHGIVYSGGQAWVGAHDAWLRRQRFDSPLVEAAWHHQHRYVAAPHPAHLTETTPISGVLTGTLE